MIGGVIGVVTVVDNERDGFTAQWISGHVTGGLHAHSDGVPNALRKLADEIDEAEEHRSGLPD